jgi:hypothetical protein
MAFILCVLCVLCGFIFHADCGLSAGCDGMMGCWVAKFDHVRATPPI